MKNEQKRTILCYFSSFLYQRLTRRVERDEKRRKRTDTDAIIKITFLETLKRAPEDVLSWSNGISGFVRLQVLHLAGAEPPKEIVFHISWI